MALRIKLNVVFFQLASGEEPVRKWLKALDAVDRQTIGRDLKTLQFGWPIGMPLVRLIDGGIWEFRTSYYESPVGCPQERWMKNKHSGSSLDDWLEEEGLLEDATAVAVKRVIAWQILQAMEKQQITKTDMAKRMHTSRAALNRLLDESDTSVTLMTLASAAAALGKKMQFQLQPD
jgi:predicted XRE-type DNA-binding protein